MWKIVQCAAINIRESTYIYVRVNNSEIYLFQNLLQKCHDPYQEEPLEIRLEGTHVWKKYLDKLRSPPIIYTLYYTLEKMQWFDAIFEIFGSAIVEAVEAERLEAKWWLASKLWGYDLENL